MKTQEITDKLVSDINDLKENCPVKDNVLMWTVFVASISAVVTELKKEVEAETVP